MKKETIKINFSWFNDLIIQIWVAINPRYWIMNEWYSSKWDKELNDLMKRYDFEATPHSYTHLVVKLGNKEIWVGNHPYASFTDYSSFRNISGRPSKLTIYKAKQKLERDLKKPRPTEVNGFIMGNPCGEIPLGDMMMSGSSLTLISNNVDDYVEITSPMLLDFEMMGNVKPEVGDLKNGIPNNWEDEV
jgi:hypothetical protein